MLDAYTNGIWAFHLRPASDGGAWLIVRTRGRGKPAAADRLMGRLFGEPAHFIMQHRQLPDLRRRLGRGVPPTPSIAQDAEEPVGARTFGPAADGSGRPG